MNGTIVRGFVALVLLAMSGVPACTFDQGGAANRDSGALSDDGSPAIDASFGVLDATGVDAPPGTPDATVVDAEPPADAPDCTGWTTGAGHFDPCLIVSPGPSLGLASPGEYTYNTNNGTLRNPSGTIIAHTNQQVAQGAATALLISTNRFSLAAGSRFRVTGDVPLIIASWSTIDIAGVLDVSSARLGNRGAGTYSGLCGANEATVGADGSAVAGGGGGGGGGGFQGDGGDGGDAQNVGKGAKGSKVGMPLIVRAGCYGAAGGTGDVAGVPGGAGGGAIQLTAFSSISVTGTIDAGGAGGGASRSYSGGGGAGSGGFIGLDGSSVLVKSGATLAANGGGGGEGADNNQDGDPGDDAAASETRALGGSGGANDGGDGGGGGFAADHNGLNGSNDKSGGGGGGGVGYIIVWSPASIVSGTANVSPAVTLP